MHQTVTSQTYDIIYDIIYDTILCLKQTKNKYPLTLNSSLHSPPLKLSMSSYFFKVMQINKKYDIDKLVDPKKGILISECPKWVTQNKVLWEWGTIRLICKEKASDKPMYLFKRYP